MRGRALFDEVVEMCGITGVLGPGLVRRALSDGDVASEVAGPRDYLDALPRLRGRLATYVPEDEAERRIAEIATMLEALLSAARAEERDAMRREMMQTGERVKRGVVIPLPGLGKSGTEDR